MARYDQEKGNNPKYASPSRDSDGNFDFTEPDRLLSRDYTQGSVIMPVRNITPTGSSAQQVIITDGTDLISINSDGSLNTSQGEGILKSSQTHVIKYLNGNGANQNIHTVTAGKTFYLMGVHISNTSGAINSAQIKDNAGTTIFRIDSSANYKSENLTSSFPIAIYTSAQNVIFNGVAGIFCTVFGYEI